MLTQHIHFQHEQVKKNNKFLKTSKLFSEQSKMKFQHAAKNFKKQDSFSIVALGLYEEGVFYLISILILLNSD